MSSMPPALATELKNIAARLMACGTLRRGLARVVVKGISGGTGLAETLDLLADDRWFAKTVAITGGRAVSAASADRAIEEAYADIAPLLEQNRAAGRPHRDSIARPERAR